MSLIENETNARMSPISDPQIHRPNSVAQRGLPHQERVRLKRQAHKMRFGTLNVGSMTGRGRAIADLMKERKVDVLCVQETRWTGNKAKELGDGFKLIYGGANNEKRNGIGIILSKDLKDLVTEVNRRNDRIMWVRLSLDEFPVNIFSVYAPQTGCPEEEKEQFWSDLQEELEKVDESERCIVGGDMNGHIGKGNDVINRIHGGNAYGDGNEDGEKIIDFALAFDLVIGNTIFCKKNEHLITYRSGDRASQIDFLLYRRNNIKEIRNCKVIPGDHVTAQHRLVVMDLSITVTRRQKGKVTTERRIKWFKLKDQDLKHTFKDRLLSDLDMEIEEVNGWWNRVSETILRVGKEVLGESSGKIWENKETWWFNEEVQQKIQAKKMAKKRWETTRLDIDKEYYKLCSKEAKRTVAIAKSDGYDNLYEELDTEEGQRRVFKLAKMRNKSTKDITHVRQVKDERGIVIQKESDILIRWKEYFEKLLNVENERFIRDDGEPNEQLVGEVTRQEVEGALKKMKNGKATGPDGIPVEVWKVLEGEGVDMLHQLIRKIMEKEVIPEKWRESTLIPIFKEKGDIQSCENYRGIKLMSHTLKVFERVLDSRLRQVVRIGRQQIGFMKGFGTVDGIFALRQNMEKHREKQKVLHMVFIDLEKAYDRIPRQEVWRGLRKRGVPEKYVRIVQECYRNVTTRVRSTVGTTDSFQVKVGLHQGSALSPLLFNIVFDVITENVREEPPWCVLYADDIVLVTERRGQLERKLEEWRVALESRGMRISRSKTEYFTTDTRGDQQATIRLNGEKLKRVKTFKYLGSMVDETGEMEKEVNFRIQCGWNNWRQVSGVICDRRVPVRVKGKVHKAVVRPALMYGLEAAPLKKIEERKMDVAEMKMLRWMVGVNRTDRIRNKYIRGTVKVVEVSKKIQESRLRWYGHLRRRVGEDHVGREIMEMEVEGVRRRGRPKRRWIDCINGDLGEKNINPEMANNRNTWRRLIHNGDPE